METDHAPRKCGCCKDETNLNQEAYIVNDDLFWLCRFCENLKDWPNQPMKL